VTEVTPDDAADDRLLSTITRELALLAEHLPGPLHRVAVTANGHAIEVEWAVTQPQPQPTTPAPDPPPAPSGPTSEARREDGAREAAGPAPAEASADITADITADIASPLVGTFYAAPEPGAEPFVRPGDTVQEGQTVAIVEAMKLMNQVTAEVPGRVVEVLVRDGDPVEYGQPLIVVEPGNPESGR
jgi:acetyl-CoA carboxylase biotin carboxyl carrier protein